jgi:hypothetical protein
LTEYGADTDEKQMIIGIKKNPLKIGQKNSNSSSKPTNLFPNPTTIAQYNGEYGMGCVGSLV